MVAPFKASCVPSCISCLNRKKNQQSTPYGCTLLPGKHGVHFCNGLSGNRPNSQRFDIMCAFLQYEKIHMQMTFSVSALPSDIAHTRSCQMNMLILHHKKFRVHHMFCRHPPFSFPMSGINLAFLHTSGQLDVVPFRSHTTPTRGASIQGVLCHESHRFPSQHARRRGRAHPQPLLWGHVRLLQLSGSRVVGFARQNRRDHGRA